MSSCLAPTHGAPCLCLSCAAQALVDNTLLPVLAYTASSEVVVEHALLMVPIAGPKSQSICSAATSDDDATTCCFCGVVAASTRLKASSISWSSSPFFLRKAIFLSLSAVCTLADDRNDTADLIKSSFICCLCKKKERKKDESSNFAQVTDFKPHHHACYTMYIYKRVKDPHAASLVEYPSTV